MTNSITHTPTGLSDVLFDEYEMKLKIENTAAEVFKERGYRMVQTPTFEYFDIYDAANPINAENLYKFFDENGRMLALRPDITTSVARLVATKCGNRPLPVRISYSGSAFRNDETFSRAKQREFTQAGVELIGASGALADAEIIEVAIDVLSRSGIEKFQIDIGQIDFFKGIVEQAGINENDANKLREKIDSKDFIGIENMISNYEMDKDVKNLLLKLPTLFGGIEIVDECLNIKSLNKRSKAALENIKEVYNCLKEDGYEKYLSVDLGLVPNLDYYTGIIIKGFTHGVGFPVCTGGRYDNLTSNFGKNMPATGVAIGIERVMEGLNADNSSADDNDEYITVALAKGRLGELSVDIFERLGFDCSEIKSKTRKLIFTDEKNKVKFILVKASDVPTYVEYGAADIGIVGKDTLLESGKNLYEVLDLGFGACKMAVAGPEKMRGKLEGRNIMRVASKYPDIAREYFHRVKGQTVDIIKLNGSVELGPLVGLSEVIVDIVESGRTLKENGLEVLEDVCELSARLVVNRVSLKVKREKIVKIIEDMKGEIK